ncbi:MAG: ABC transporter permease [Lactobacillus sp.]
MFLALKEIKHEKLRYSLIVLIILLISYLIFLLSALAIGLASQNTQAINSWQAKTVVLNENANLSLTQSVLTKKDLQDWHQNADTAYIGQVPTVAKKAGRPSVSAQFFGIKSQQFIYQKQVLLAGKRARAPHQVTVDVTFKQKGYRLGDWLKLSGAKGKYQITGFVRDAKYNIAPIIYGTLPVWRKMRLLGPDVVASAVIYKRITAYHHGNAKHYPIAKLVAKLPGYHAQNLTFGLMIGFLFVISLMIIAVFLYILTIQKLQNFAVMRAQGIPSRVLVSATIVQAVILMIVGVALALALMQITLALLPAAVPIAFPPMIGLVTTVGMLLMGVLGSFIPVRSILKVDPAQAIS